MFTGLTQPMASLQLQPTTNNTTQNQTLQPTTNNTMHNKTTQYSSFTQVMSKALLARLKQTKIQQYSYNMSKYTSFTQAMNRSLQEKYNKKTKTIQHQINSTQHNNTTTQQDNKTQPTKRKNTTKNTTHQPTPKQPRKASKHNQKTPIQSNTIKNHFDVLKPATQHHNLLTTPISLSKPITIQQHNTWVGAQQRHDNTTKVPSKIPTKSNTLPEPKVLPDCLTRLPFPNNNTTIQYTVNTRMPNITTIQCSATQKPGTDPFLAQMNKKRIFRKVRLNGVRSNKEKFPPSLVPTSATSSNNTTRGTAKS
jgi:hypothetical protein